MGYGFLDFLGDAAGGLLVKGNNALFNGVGDLAKGASGSSDTNGTIPGAVAPTENPYLKETLAKQKQIAKDYRDSIPQASDSIYGGYAKQAKGQLANSLKSVDKDYNRRGLLRSGARVGAQYGTQAAAQSDLANTRESINSGLLSNADQLDNNVTNTAGAMAGLGVNLGDSIAGTAKSNLANTIAGNQANQSIYQGVGQAAGGLAGAFNNAKQNPSYWNPKSPTDYGYGYNGVNA